VLPDVETATTTDPGPWTRATERGGTGCPFVMSGRGSVPAPESNDDYKQAGDLFRLMTDAERHRLIDNIVDSMKSVAREIQLRQIEHFRKADPAYGEGIARGLKAAAAATADQ
jgi:catalase